MRRFFVAMLPRDYAEHPRARAVLIHLSLWLKVHDMVLVETESGVELSFWADFSMTGTETETTDTPGPVPVQPCATGVQVKNRTGSRAFSSRPDPVAGWALWPGKRPVPARNRKVTMARLQRVVPVRPIPDLRHPSCPSLIV